MSTQSAKFQKPGEVSIFFLLVLIRIHTIFVRIAVHGKSIVIIGIFKNDL